MQSVTSTMLPFSPWDPSRSAGGSSGGSAAAIASGMVPLATGSDGGGSIRIPSAVHGLSGIKTSLGRIPGGGATAPRGCIVDGLDFSDAVWTGVGMSA